MPTHHHSPTHSRPRPWPLAGLALMVGLSGCGAGTSPPADTSAPPAARLHIQGALLAAPDGRALRLRGVNVEGVTAQDVDTIADAFRMNLIRLRISFIPENRADTESGFSDAYRAQIDEWVDLIKARRLWMVLELRANDNVANSADFYDTTRTAACAKPTSCADFGYYLKAWRYLASRYKDTDYIAGYGLLAEPSADKAGLSDPQRALVEFQKTLMDAISAIDPRTPFFIGPNYNYDTMEYAQDLHFDHFMPTYRDRLVYEVNYLTPKEWITRGEWTVDAGKPTYPFADPADGYASLLEGLQADTPPERVYNQRRVEPGNYEKTLSKGHIAWYLQWPLQFRARHQVPLYVDQFGAGTEAQGQLAYEADLIDFFEANELHWTRWSYNAGGPEGRGRTLLPPNDAAMAFYRSLAARW